MNSALQLLFPVPTLEWCRQRSDFGKIGRHIVRQGRNGLLEPKLHGVAMVTRLPRNSALRQALLCQSVNLLDLGVASRLSPVSALGGWIGWVIAWGMIS